MTASKQLLVNFTSTSGSLNFGMIIVDYFLVHPKFIQSCILVLNLLVDSACTTLLGRLFHRLTTLLVKKNLRRSYLVQFFCNLKSFPLVVCMVDVVSDVVQLPFHPRSFR